MGRDGGRKHTRMFVVAIPWAPFGGKVSRTLVDSSAPVALYLVIADATVGNPRSDSGTIW